MSYDCLLFKVVLGRVSLKKPVRAKGLNCFKGGHAHGHDGGNKGGHDGGQDG